MAKEIGKNNISLEVNEENFIDINLYKLFEFERSVYVISNAKHKLYFLTINGTVK